MTRRSPASILAAVAFALLLVTPSVSHALEIKRMKLRNGAVLLVSEQRQLPMVTLSIAFDAGARRDPEGKEGLAVLTANSLTQGTKKLSAIAFNRRVDFLGSSVSVSAGRDFATAGLTTLKRYLPETLALLAGVLTQPGLRDRDIERKREQQVASIKSSEERPGYVAAVTFARTLFGAGPYGHPRRGSVASVAKLTPRDVRSFYRSHYRMGSAVIAVAGDVEAAKIKAMLEKELAGLAGTVTVQPKPAPVEVPPGLHLKLIDRNVAQANIILGFGGVARTNPDFYRLQVMNYILGGGGFSSRLVKTIRSKAGLAYSVSSSYQAGRFPGSFTVSLQTKNKSANQALRLILDQLRKIRSGGVTDSELESARKFLVGSFPLRIDRQSAIAGFMLRIELFNLGLDYAEKYPALINAVTKEDVRRVARQYLHPDALIVVAVANQKEAAITRRAVFASASGITGAAGN